MSSTISENNINTAQKWDLNIKLLVMDRIINLQASIAQKSKFHGKYFQITLVILTIKDLFSSL